MTGQEVIDKYKALIEEIKGTEVSEAEYAVLSEMGAPVQYVEEVDPVEAGAEAKS